MPVLDIFLMCCTHVVATPGADELVGCLQRICKSFGIGGVYNSKKR